MRAGLDGGGLQNLERLGAGHDAAEAVLAILLEGEAFLPRQPAQMIASLCRQSAFCPTSGMPVYVHTFSCHENIISCNPDIWQIAQSYSASAQTVIVLPVAAVICTMMP